MAKQQNPTTQAPKSEEAVKAARAAKKAAKRAKRAAALKELLNEQGATAVNMRINYREFRVGIEGLLTPAKDSSWKAYCEFKAATAATYWQKQAEKPAISEKKLARKKARLLKAREAMAKLEAELAALEQTESK